MAKAHPRLRSHLQAAVLDRGEGQGGAQVGVHDDVHRSQGRRRKVGGIAGGKVVGLLNVTEVGRPQRISAPESTGSFADFEFALDALGDAQDGR